MNLIVKPTTLPNAITVQQCIIYILSKNSSHKDTNNKLNNVVDYNVLRENPPRLTNVLLR